MIFQTNIVILADIVRFTPYVKNVIGHIFFSNRAIFLKFSTGPYIAAIVLDKILIIQKALKKDHLFFIS